LLSVGSILPIVSRTNLISTTGLNSSHPSRRHDQRTRQARNAQVHAAWAAQMPTWLSIKHWKSKIMSFRLIVLVYEKVTIVNPSHKSLYPISSERSIIPNRERFCASGCHCSIPAPSAPSHNIDPRLLENPINRSPLTDYRLPGAVVDEVLASRSPLPQNTMKPTKKQPTPRRKGAKSGDAENLEVGTPQPTLTAAQKQAATRAANKAAEEAKGMV